jgi:hypothetical protein
MRTPLVCMLVVLGITGCAVHSYESGEDGVRLYLRNPDARSVSFASSLDGFRLHKARKMDGGMWEVRVRSRDEFTYFYIVDGVLYAPPCPLREQDDFGSENCIYSPDL